jgi:hypothetical protein
MKLLIRLAVCVCCLIANAQFGGAQIATTGRVAAVGFILVAKNTGATFRDCYVDKFIDDHRTDLANRFQGLKSTSIPYGRYDYELKRRDSRGTVRGYAFIGHPEVLVVVPTTPSELGGFSEDRVIPNDFVMTGRLEPAPQRNSGDEPIWVKLTSIFGSLDVDVQVDNAGTFRIYDWLRGPYILTVLRSQQVLHVHEVSFHESVMKGATFSVNMLETFPPAIRVQSH